MSDEYLIRSAGLRGFRATVAELGGNADHYAELAGLPVSALDIDDMLVSDVAIARALEIAAHDLDCHDLGLRIAGRQDLNVLGPLWLAVRNTATLADALEYTSRYLFMHARPLNVTRVPDPYGADGAVALRFGSVRGRPNPIQGTDLCLGLIHRSIRFLVGGSYSLLSVELPYSPRVPIARYEQFFGAQVRCDRPDALLRVPLRLQTMPVAGSDEELLPIALALLSKQPHGPGGAIAPRVRGILQESLGTSNAEVESVARLLAMHPRTLQRQLTAEGVSFSEILDNVRRRQTYLYLTTTRMPLSQVAALVGLSEQSALARCCRRWWGTTPSGVRRGEVAEQR
ncbi:AraC family transcriptional regulator ligand-binding domain-containing protein [Nocardia sp. NPDC056952]|uniref:AraC family transcriptional regulator n=1 Tax=Nocardia sp. NPDC056952 TaxID=3345979 RepID=UPI003641C779